MRKGVCFVGFILLGILLFTIGFVGASYPTETESLDKLTSETISQSEAVDIVEDAIEDILSQADEVLENNSDDQFYLITKNLYSSFKDVGGPKLIFDEEKALIYSVPLLLSSGEVGGFMGLDPYSGEIKSYPGFNSGGEPAMNLNYNSWKNLEKNMADEGGVELTNESRLINVITSPFSSITYLAIPKESKKTSASAASVSSGQEVKRIGIGSIFENKFFELNEIPKVDEEFKEDMENGKEEKINTKEKTVFISFASGGEPIYPPYNEPDLTISFLIPGWDNLPFKDQRATEDWTKYINDNFNPSHEWDEDFFCTVPRVLGVCLVPEYWGFWDGTAWKCLSYSASTVADWWNFEHGQGTTVNSYKSFLRYGYEFGTNPRELEAMFHYRHAEGGFLYTYAPYSVFDSVTGEDVPYNLQGYAQILLDSPYSSWTDFRDPEFSIPLSNPYHDHFYYDYWQGKYGISNYYPVPLVEQNILSSLRENGILYAQIDHILDIFPGVSGIHAVPIIGYGQYIGKNVFIYQDSYGQDFGKDKYSSYKVIESNQINEVWSFRGVDYNCTPYSIILPNEIIKNNLFSISWDNPCFSKHTNVHLCRPGNFCYPNSDISTSILYGEDGWYQQAISLNESGTWKFFIHSQRFGGQEYYSQVYSINVQNINCSSNSQCGTNGYTGSNYCGANGNVYRNYTIHICNNPGTPSSYCSNQTTAQLIQTCNYGCTSGVCNSPPPLSINITSPTNNAIFNDRRVMFNIQLNKQAKVLEFIDYSDLRPEWDELCDDCSSYYDDERFSDGEHKVIFRASASPYVYESVNFTIDSKDPRISKTEPRRNSFTNGTGFYIKVKEDNLKNITITFNPTIALNLSKCTESKGYKECYANLDLTDYNNQEINYNFTVEDIAGNKDGSKPTFVKVDTTAPVLNNPSSFWHQGTGRYQRYIYFNFDITEENFDEIVYTYTDSRGRLKEKRICSRLRDGVCEVRKSFSDGNYILPIIIKDEAGNSQQEVISFTVV